MKEAESTRTFSDNRVNNIWEFHEVLVQVPLVTSNTKLDTLNKKLCIHVTS